MIDLNVAISSRGIIEAFARLKNISVAKVVTTASRDFAQAALGATPVANKSRSEYYKFWDDRKGDFRYLHESMVIGRKRKSLKGLRKVRIYKGWSRSSWIGVFRALGMSVKKAASRLPNAVEHISHAITRGGTHDSHVTMTDNIRFDQFGKVHDTKRIDAIATAGFKLAAKRITVEMNKMIHRQWSSQ